MKSESTERKPLVILGELRGIVERFLRCELQPQNHYDMQSLVGELEQAILREQLETSLVLQKAIQEAGQ